MRKWIILVALCIPCFAQIQGNLPHVIDSCQDQYTSSPGSGNCQFQEGFSSGQLLVVFGHARESIVSAPTVSDNSGLGNSYTCTTPASDPANTGSSFICYAAAAGTTSSVVTVTVSYTNPSGGRTEIARFANVATTPEASASGSVGNGGGIALSVSITTVHSGALILSSLAIGSGSDCFCYPSTPLEQIAPQDLNGADSYMMQTGNAGSYTTTYNFVAGSGGSQGRVATVLAFAPAATAVSETQMPDGAQSVAYSAQLHGLGGTAAFTCSISVGSLPTGLSLGGTGNCTISGTPSGSVSTTSFTVHVDDGAGHTASQALSIKIGATLNIPQIVMSVAFHPQGTEATQSIAGVRCGDVIVIIPLGDNVFDFYGMLNTVTGANNFWKGSLGETYSRYYSQPISGTRNAPQPVLISTPTTTSGTDVIDYKTSFGSAHAGVSTIIVVIRGTQGVVDPGTVTYLYRNGTNTQLTLSFTSLVPNTLVMFYSSASFDDLTGISGVSLGSPFTQITSWIDSEGQQVAGYYLAPTTGSTSETVTWASTGPNSFSAGIFGMRPSIVGGVTCAGFSGLGEKIRRATW